MSETKSRPETWDDTERYIQEQEHVFHPDKPSSFFNHFDCRACGPGPLKRNEIPSQWRHVFYKKKIEERDDGYGGSWKVEIRREVPPSEATIVSSELAEERGTHTIMLDIDIPARLVESSTRGHYHLYIDHKLSWRRYRRLLRALMKAGLIEPGYYKMSKIRKATHLRPPWVQK